tara:strand:+ start:1274 stop:2875 length:1602 start_codon:yes stop_codon:yes gene_type:complete
MSNLLDKSSILLTPTAYNDGKILSVKPNTSVGDFDFTRNSSATRVNSQGLIEDMQILSGDLVTNGDFSNGANNWSLGTGWSIGVGKVIGSSASGTLSQAGIASAGKQYKVTINITDYSSGTLYVDIGGSSAQTSTSNGLKTFYFTSTSTGSLRFYGGSFTGSIDNVLVIEITDDTNLPRIDYTGGVGHWLFEPQSTNLIPYSEDLTQWANILYTLVESNSTISPDGSVNADKLVAGATNGLQLRIAPLSLTSGNTYTFSTYVKNSGGNYVILYMNDTDSQGIKVDLVNETFVTMGSSTNHFIKNFNNGWYQIGFTRAIDANVSGLNAVPSLDGNNVSFLGDGVNGVYLWGTQVEENSFATSIIPTEGAIKTRLQDAAFGAGSSDLINSTEGVLYAEIASFISLDTVEPNRYITLTNGTSNERVALLLGGNSNQLRAIIFSSTQSINLSFTTSLTEVKQFNKLAIKYKSGDYAFFLNGIKIGGSTETNIFTADTLNDLSFDVGGGTQKFRGKVKCAAVFKEAITDAELTCLTTI